MMIKPLYGAVLRCVAVVPLAFALAGPLRAQGTTVARAKADALLKAARASVAAGDTDQAVKQYQAARKADPKYTQVHIEYGQLLSARSDMGFQSILMRKNAADALKDAIDVDPGNPWPYLELGRLRLKMPLMRIAAENLFKQALEVAIKTGVPEAVGDISFEIGQIYDRRYRTMAHRHMMVGDAKILDPFGAQYEKDYVENFLRNSAVEIDEAGELDAGKAEEWYRKALAAAPGHENAATALSALLYEVGRFSEMQGVAHSAAAAQPASARLRLADGLALLKLRKFEQASETLESAVKLMTDRERNLVASLAPILRPTDARAYETLDAASRATRDRQYWELADPLYLTNINEQRLAHLGRVAYADLMFSTYDLKVRGALTDRGDIVIRYGEPPTIATFQPDVQAKNNAETMGRVTTLWWYPEPMLKFVFTGPPAMTSATFAGDFYGYSDELRYKMPVKYESLPGGLTTDTMPVQVSRFRGNQPQNVRVEFHSVVPVDKLASKAGAAPMSVETGFMIQDASLRRIFDGRDTVRIRADDAKATLRSFSKQFVPGEYFYRVEALERASMAGAIGKGALSIASFPSNSLALSDVLIGSGVRSLDLRRREDLDMDVVPNASFDPTQTLGLYWETYGAKPSSAGAINLHVELSMTIIEIERGKAMHLQLLGGIADRLNISEEGDKKVTVSFDRTLPAPGTADDRILNAYNLQLSGMPAGQYVLEIKTTDKETGQTAKSSHAVRIRRQ
jgi:GWxTD domain-containing protein